LSALLRVADALDFRREQRVEAVSCAVGKNKSLTITAIARANVSDEIGRALKKGKLIEEVFNLKLSFKRAQTNRVK
jgi:hypothetical protein